MTGAAIARAEAVDGALNAIVTPTFTRARIRARSKPTGILAGVPTFVKDSEPVAGAPTRVGSRAIPATVAVASSPFVRQYLALGLNPLGTTTMPELGLTATTEPALGGPTHNPWDRRFSTGGSSGGSAALVAAGVVPIAHANDGGGSIRIPAACCGLVGLKPSRGRVRSRAVPPVFPIDLVVQGVVSRTVRDTSAFLRGAELHDVATGRRHDLPPIGEVTGPAAARLRIGLVVDSNQEVEIDPWVVAETERVGALCEGLGHRVAPIPCPFPADVGDRFLTLWAYAPFLVRHLGRGVFGSGFDADHLEPWTRYLATYFRRRIHRAPATFRRLARYRQEYRALFRELDVILSPTLARPTPELGVLSTDLPGDEHYRRVAELVPYTPFLNLAGAPGASLPLARSESQMPIGIHLAADVGAERTLLELAFELESAQPWPSVADPF